MNNNQIPGEESIKEIEEKVLAIALNDNKALSDIIFSLQVEDFNNNQNKMLYKAIKKIYEQKNNVDPLVVLNLIEADKDYYFKDFDIIINNIISQYTHSVDLKSYIDTIKNFSIVRNLNKFSKEIQNPNINFENFNDELWNLEKKFLKLLHSKTNNSFLTCEEVAKQYKENLENIKSNRGKITGTSSGFEVIDNFTNGFQPGDLIILAARPSIGKTALSLNMLLNSAKDCKQNEYVVMFSLEMGANQLFQRLVSCESGISSDILRNGNWSSEDEYLIEESIKKISKLNIVIDDSSNATIIEIQTKLKQLYSDGQNKIKLVVVDYLQLVQGSIKNGVNRQQEVSQISRTLKSIARDIDSPIIAVAQLSRKIEERKGADKKPMLSDLRESGSIEQDADLVTFINYDRDEIDENNTNESTKKYLQNVIVEFIIAKHRNGATGEATLLFEKAIGKYSDYNK